MTKRYREDFRKEVVKLYLDGMPASKIAKLKNIRRSNIYDWLDKVANHKNNPHGNKKYSEEFKRCLEYTLSQNPYLSTRELSNLEYEGITYKPSKTHLHAIIKNLGFTYLKEKKQWVK